MSFYYYTNKIFGLLGTLNNPYYFLYRVCHYLNKDVPQSVAEYIYKSNKKDYQKKGPIDFIIETYEGSGQSVHPDIAFWDNKYWLVLTPYPYGMEEYENPSIYVGETLSSLLPTKTPLATQRIRKQGFHLSDPCIAICKDKLFCFYRESERRGTSEDNIIWSTYYVLDRGTWSTPETLFQSDKDKILSPAMLFDAKDDLVIYYVSTLDSSYSLVKTDDKASVLTQQIIEGMPQSYYLWHIGIKKTIELSESEENSSKLSGLFLMKSVNNKSQMKLFEAEGSLENNSWQITNEVEMPKQLTDSVLFPYKSCYISNQFGDIFLSFCDKRHRYRLMTIHK